MVSRSFRRPGSAPAMQSGARVRRLADRAIAQFPSGAGTFATATSSEEVRSRRALGSLPHRFRSRLERTLRSVLLLVVAIMSSYCYPDLLRRVERAMAAEGETVGKRRAG